MLAVAHDHLVSPPAGSLALALTLVSPPAGSLALALTLGAVDEWGEQEPQLAQVHRAVGVGVDHGVRAGGERLLRPVDHGSALP